MNWQTRLVQERDDLKQKHDALDAFINSEKYHGIDIHQRQFLSFQLIHMGSYLRILDERIADLTNEKRARLR